MKFSKFDISLMHESIDKLTPGQPYLTTRELADKLGVSTSTVRVWVHRGELTPVMEWGNTYLFLESAVPKTRNY